MNILVLGGDERYSFLVNELNKQYNVDTAGILSMNEYDIIIFPIKGINKNYEIISQNGTKIINSNILSKTNKNVVIYTGLITDTLIEMAHQRKIISFLDDKIVKKENDLITVESIKSLVDREEVENICILGYGDIGKLLEQNLIKYNLFIGVKDNKLKNREFCTNDINQMKLVFSQCDLIINTVPKNIITENVINNKSKIIDIASAPYGANEYVRNKFENYYIYSGIPGKFAPEASGKVLAKKIKRDIGGKK